MNKSILCAFLAVCLIGSVSSAVAQTPQASTLVDIPLNGIPVVVDGNLEDWDDAHFVFLSQDSPFFLQITNNQPVQGVPFSPDDFSAFVALKMTNDAIYVAARVRDEGVPLFPTPATPNLAFDYDHLSLYLGLYDIGDRAKSPHVEGTNPAATTNFMHLNPAFADSMFESNRHYRIGPGLDNTTSTLGADYQLLLRALEHDPASFDSRAHTYNGAYVDTTIPGTTAAVVLWDDEKGYNIEWRIPFASLAGKISRQQSLFRDFEWPLFVPQHNMTIVFDVDVTDRDQEAGLNTYLRAGRYPSLWRDSHNFGMRGRIVDLSQHDYDRPNSKYYIDYKPVQNVTIDADMSDWADAMFYGNSQDHPHFMQITNNQPVQGIPSGPADFSYYYAMKMDDDNLYVGLIVRDEGTPMILTPATPNLAFTYDHLSVYLGLFDLGNRGKSPHIEGTSPGSTNFNHLNPAFPDSSFEANRHYRIGPGLDDTESTLGPDFQLLIRALEHDPATFDSRAHTYNGAYVDTTIPGTVAAGRLWDDENGYFLEWKIPFSSLSGQISKRQSPFRDFSWPHFTPEVGATIVFDADVTDLDDGDRGNNRFMRIGRYPSLWRDSHNFGMRGQIIQNGTVSPVSIDFDDIAGGTGELPTSIGLSQNYPNPFNPSTTIRYELPVSANVRLSVYNMLGQEVAVLVNGVRPSGVSTVQFDASNLSSGIYVYRLTSGTETITRKMLLVK